MSTVVFFCKMYSFISTYNLSCPLPCIEEYG